MTLTTITNFHTALHPGPGPPGLEEELGYTDDFGNLVDEDDEYGSDEYSYE